MGYYLGSRALPMDRPWKTETAQYPANWLRLSSTADRAAIGVTWGADEGTWDQRFYWGVDNPKQLDDVTDENGNTTTGLKTLWKSKQNEIAGTLIAPSDWRIIKAKETSTNIPSVWKTYRAAVRTSCNTRQTEIDACTTVEELKELLFGSATITRQQTDADGNGVVEPDTIVDDDANEVANPVAGQPVMETVANPNIATAWPTEPS
jgi:hypothetical protein